MSTVAPPPPPSVPPPPLPGAPILTVPLPPPALTAAALHARLDALVLAQPGPGQLQLQTSFGTFTVQTSLAQTLAQGATLGLVVQALVPQVKLLLSSIDGQPLTQALKPGATAPLAQPGGAPLAGSANAAATTGPSTVTLTVGSTAIATVLRPPPGVIGQTTSLPGAGSTPVASPSAPAVQPGVPPAPPQPTAAPFSPSRSAAPSAATPTSSTPTASASPAPSAPAAVSFPQKGVTFPVRITAVQPPPGEGGTPVPPRASPVPLNTGTVLQAVVLRSASAGTAVLETPVGELTLPVRASLAPGTQVGLEVTAPPSTTKPAPSPPVLPATLIRDGDWPALRDAMTLLAQLDPASANHLSTHVMPRPDGHMGAAMMFFLSALRGGDFRAWFGDGAVRTLERGRADLAARLGDDFGGMKRLVDAAPSNDWRSFLVPFHPGQEIAPIRLHVRQGTEEEDEDARNAGTRFLVDVTLTQLGRIQLDGLVRSREKHMDLIVRSDRPFPATIRADILTIYSNASDVTGMKGGLSFQADPPNFIDVVPTDPAAGGDGAGVLV